MEEAEAIVRDAARKNKVQAPLVIFKETEVRLSFISHSSKLYDYTYDYIRTDVSASSNLI